MQMYDHIIKTNTFTTKSYGKLFEILSSPLHCNKEKVPYLLRGKFRMILHLLKKLKQRSVFCLINIKLNANLLKKESRMYHRSIFIYTMLKIVSKITVIEKSIYLFIYLSIYLFVYSFIYSFIYLFIYLFEQQQNIMPHFHFLFTCLCVWLLVNLFVHLSFCFSA